MTADGLQRVVRAGRGLVGAAAAAVALWAPEPGLRAQPVDDAGLIVIPGTDMRGAGAAGQPGDPRSRARVVQSRAGASEGDTGAGAVPLERRWLSPLRPVDQGDGGEEAAGSTRLRFGGEREVREFRLFADAADTARELRIVTQSSIHVLPERSRMRVFLNGGEVGSRQLENFTEPRAATFTLPPELLERGANRVRIEMEHFHRIYCGPEAAFGLWTDIDLARSGIGLDPADLAPGAEGFLMALAGEAARRRPVEIRADGALAPRWQDWLGRLTTRLDATLSGAPLVYRFAPRWTVHDAAPAQARITFMPGEPGRVRFVRGGDGARVMVVETGDGAPPEIDGIFPPVAQRAPIARLAPGRETALADLGFETLRASQHYLKREQVFRLPEDWLILTAAKARLRFDYAYAEGLPEGAMLLVQINGETIRMLPLEDEGGRLITRFPVDFQARLLNGGANTLGFELFVPGNPPDLPCGGDAGPVLELRASSTLHVPDSPRMAMPDMEPAFARLGPDSLTVAAPTDDGFSDGDLLGLTAALARGRPEGEQGRAPRLHLVAFDHLGSVPAGDFQLGRRVLEDVLLPQSAELTDDAPAAAPPRETEDDRADRFAALYGEDAAPPPDNGEEPGPGWGAQALAVATDLARGASDLMMPRTGQRLQGWLSGQNGLAVLLQLDYDRPEDIWLVPARDADISDIAAAIVRARQTGEGPAGQVSVLQRDGEWRNWAAPDRRPALREPLSLGNMRLVMGNFVSTVPIYFTLALFVLAVFSALVALRFVISTREKSS
ncbi:hypothetical protein C2I36_10185 [Rhodobacteraceae bacterium WD3A24]|nr:hypothetical protein C2I36_10185 [Rhodobacteraceae bacterium WD3A24]